MVVVDASFMIALHRQRDDRHGKAAAWYERELEATLVTTPVVLAEMDHMLRRYLGTPAQRIVAANIATRALEVDWWEGAVDSIWKIVDSRPDIGVADASLVALAAHRNTSSIATFDERRFRSLEPLTGEGAFTLLPADAD